MNHLVQAATILRERTLNRKQRLLTHTATFQICGENLGIHVDISLELEPDHTELHCAPCAFQIVKAGSTGIHSTPSQFCPSIQPKVSLTGSVISAYNDEPFITNQIFVDGDPVIIEAREFDLMFYLHYVDRFIQSETELVTFLRQFDASFKPNTWYQKGEGGWLHRLISDSRWNSVHLKALFGCLRSEDGLAFLESGELEKHGYELVVKAFKIKYANTSKSIVTDADVARKLETWVPRNLFNDHLNQLFDQQIQNFKTRKKTYYDQDLDEWRQYDGSLEAKKKIFLSQFSRYPEFEIKRGIIQKLIRRAENEVRTERGFTVVGTLVNESILYSKLKEHFSMYTVLSQYCPKWLGRQSLDIYIEELRVGIEYQGDQHTRPVEFFGGAEAFEKTKQRDQKKLDRCRRNGCRLVYVYPGYNFDEIVNQILRRSK
jgi:hypothetical protein